MAIDKEGNLFLAGEYEDKSFITKIGIDGTVFWTKTFDFSHARYERIIKIIIDSKGLLVGLGRGRELDLSLSEAFIFKFDPETQILIWSSGTESGNPGINPMDILEMPGSGNYLVSGDVSVGTDNNAALFVFHRDGYRLNSFPHSFKYEKSARFSRIKYLGGNILAIGSTAFEWVVTPGNVTSFNQNTRGVLTLLSQSGRVIWSQNYITPISETAQLFGIDLAIENNKIYSVFQGNRDDYGSRDSDMFFMISDYSGNPSRLVQFDLPGVSLEPRKMYSTDDHFFIEMRASDGYRYILAKLDKTGDLIYAFSFKNDPKPWVAALENASIVRGNRFLSSKLILNGDRNISLIDIPIEGIPDFEDCREIEFLNIKQSEIPNPFKENNSFSKINLSWRAHDNMQPVNEESFELTGICVPDCSEDCVNGTDDDGDGLVDCDDPDCPCFDHCLGESIPDARLEVKSVICAGENIVVEFTICNIGQGVLPSKIPVLFYSQDPRAINSIPFFGYEYQEEIGIDTCATSKVEIPNPGNGRIFILANADNDPPPPYDLASDFPITGIDECDFINNIDSAELNFIKNYFVDLGPDIALCPDKSHLLSADFNYQNLRWSDGSTEQTLTVFEPGEYWTCVQDDCGNRACDTVKVSVDNSFLFELGDDQNICEGEAITIAVSGFQNQSFQWHPSDNLPCNDCPSNTFTPHKTTTYTVVGTTDDGCVSTDKITVSVHLASENFDTIQFCRGDTVRYAGVDFYESDDRVFQYQNALSCDSILNLNLLVGDTFRFDQKISICENERANVFGDFINTPGIYTQNLKTALGCDSSYVVELDVKNTVFSEEQITICEKDSALIFGIYQHESGIWSQSVLAENGCDSLHEIRLNVNPSFHFFDTLKLCSDDIFDFHGMPISEPGSYVFPIKTSLGCDSVFYLETIAARDTVRNFSTENICEGDTIFLYGNPVFQNGIYSQTDDDGLCAKIEETEVVFNQLPVTFDTVTTCAGTPISVFGNQKDTPGTYSEVFNSARFCDSTHSITLEVKDTFQFFTQISICRDEEVNIFGNLTNVPGIYTQNLQTAEGCDSNFVIELVVRDTSKIIEPISICENDSIEIFGDFEYLPGIYSQTFPSINGCDSLHEIELSLNQTYEFFDVLEICTGDTLDFFGTAIFEQGDFQHIEQTSKGCDSVFNLKIIPARDTTFDFQSENICPGDTILVFGSPIFENGIFTEIDDDGFCVSVREVMVNIGEISETFDTVSTCSGDPISIFGTQADDADTYLETYNRLGKCDSVHSITLEVRDTFYDFQNLQICSGGQVNIFGAQVFAPGLYSQNFTSSNGCDSLAVINLSVDDTLKTEEVQSICKNDSILIFNNYESIPGRYAQSTSSPAGCDSLHVIWLENYPDFSYMTATEKACFDDDSGVAEIQILVQGDFKFSWENGEESSILSDLQSGMYRFTVTDENGCSKHDSILVENDFFEIITDELPPQCFRDTNGSIEIISDESNLEFSLNNAPFSDQNIFENLLGGIYSIAVRNSSDCIFETEIELPEPEMLTVTLPGDTILSLGDSIELAPLSDGSPISFSWSPTTDLDCSNCPAVIAAPKNSTTYFIEISDVNNCFAKDSIRIEIQAGDNYFIPSAFSPNGDGYNDFFTVYGNRNLEIIEQLSIYDRWGELIWKGENFLPNVEELGWDGKFRGNPLISKVFAFYSILRFKDGKKIIEKGDLTLKR